MLDTELFNYVSHSQGVDPEKLKRVTVAPSSPEVLKWAQSFIYSKQCFSNAMNMSMVGECGAVVGYVLLPKFGISIEHAWNRDSEGDFDLTADLHWNNNEEENNVYVELVYFSFEQVSELYGKEKGIDHLALRRDDQYKDLFKRNQSLC